MAKILIVPDVHGRKFWHKAKELIDEVDQEVFLGDYLDPYSREGITFEDALNEFEEQGQEPTLETVNKNRFSQPEDVVEEQELKQKLF